MTNTIDASDMVRMPISDHQIHAVAVLLVSRSAWFEVTPLPDGEWWVRVKPEHEDAVCRMSQVVPLDIEADVALARARKGGAA